MIFAFITKVNVDLDLKCIMLKCMLETIKYNNVNSVLFGVHSLLNNLSTANSEIEHTTEGLMVL